MIQITGDKELQRALEALEPKVAKKCFRQAMRPAMKEVIAPGAKARVPVLTGALKKSIKIRAAKRSRKSIGIDVTINGKSTGQGTDEYYAKFVEYGTKRSKPQPFMRTSYAQDGGIAIDLALVKLKDLVEVEAGKLNTAS